MALSETEEKNKKTKGGTQGGGVLSRQVRPKILLHVGGKTRNLLLFTKLFRRVLLHQ